MKNIIFLTCIFAVGFLLRTILLGDVPNGFHRDEAFLGYNAFSILQTGKEMTGDSIPLHLRSFLFTPAGYSYFSIPFIWMMGLNVFSVRFASALFGSLTIIILYYFVLSLFENNFLNSLKKHKESIALLSALLLSISPWHISLSRTASTSALVLFFILLGVYLYSRWNVKENILFLIFSFASFLVSLGFYIAPYSFLPLLVPIMFFAFKTKKKALQIGLYVVIILIPLALTLSSSNLSLRVRSLSIANSNSQVLLDEKIREDGVSEIPANMTRVFHNKIIRYAQIFTQNYFNHYSYAFLFTDTGLPDRYRIPEMGILYLFEIPFILLGLYVVIRMKDRIGMFLIAWLLVAPIGSSLSTDDVPNLQRTLFMVVPIFIFEGIGFMYLLQVFKKHAVFIKVASVVVVSSMFIFYLHEFYIHATKYRPWYRQDGYKELVSKINNYEKNYDSVVVTNRESAPTIFFLFFNSYSPEKFQEETKDTTMKDFDRIGYSKYTFSEEECPLKTAKNVSTGKENTLYVNSSLCDIDGFRLIDTVKRADGSKAFYIVSL